MVFFGFITLVCANLSFNLYDMNYLYLKALHIIFVVIWFSGLFYMVRLMIYTREAQNKPNEERSILTQQLLVMQSRLWYIITWPGALGTTIFGLWMIFVNPALLKLPWMHFKLFLVFLLWAYHLRCQIIHNAQKKGRFYLTSFALRLWNEIPTLLLVSVVFLAVVKSQSGFMWGLVLVLLLGSILFIASLLYKKSRKE